MKSRQLKLWSAGLTLLLLAAAAVSQTVQRTHMRGGMMWSERSLSFFTDYLSLTDDQQAQIKQILAKEKPAFQPLMEQTVKQRQQMMQLVESGTFDETKAQAIAAQQSQNLTQLMVQRARVGSELFQVLTPEQKTKMIDLLNKREAKFGHRFGQDQPQGGSDQLSQ